MRGENTGKRAKKHSDDDGRTIASMDQVESPINRHMFVPRRPGSALKPKDAPKPQKPAEDLGLTKQEERQVVRGAQAATLLAALVFFAILAAFLCLCVFVWFK